MLRYAFAALLFFVTTTVFPQYSIEGTISNEKDAILEGASILIRENNLGTISDRSGKFILEELDEDNYTLQVSYMGYETLIRTVYVDKNISLDFKLQPSTFWGEEIIVRATRADKNTPTTYTVVEKAEIEKQNLGQDLPYLLSMEPSLVYSSDAGAGVGYTSLWIRGSNIQRINVTINGIPLNDPESHGVFWVNMPDFASSIQSAQIQRGVGTSTNGGGAFGATMNLETNYINREAFGQISSSFGSFDTWKNTFRAGTGLIKEKWAFEGRVSSLTSDGYIDRSSSNLKSFFLQGGYYGNSTVIKAVIFGGKERTYQAWYGIDKETLESDRTFNWAGAIYDENWNITGFYNNETDNYQQDHYQLHISQLLAPGWHFNGALHYTYGRGYYEQYYSNEYLADYPIGIQYFGYDSLLTSEGFQYYYHDTISYGDMIVRRWLDNHFYGTTFAFHYSSSRSQFTLGGAYNKYAHAKHYGELIWAEFAGDTKAGDKFYNNVSDKTDLNIYSKLDYSLTTYLSLFADLQIRQVDYTDDGTDKGNDTIAIDDEFLFFNPKAGITYVLKNIGTLYASYAVSHREPIRTDFLDAPAGVVPKPEQLQDIEAGIRRQGKIFHYAVNGYLMLYTNQLVLTGEINDVGSPVRANVGKSYRLGLEADADVLLNKYFSFRGNIALSKNLTDYRQIEYEEIVEYTHVPLPFSPSLVSGVDINIAPFDFLEATINGKFVSRQYLDLTGSDQKSLDPYFINNLIIAWSIRTKSLHTCRLSLQINNLFNVYYTSNGYVWEGVPYYYPQAGLHMMAGIDLRF